MSALVEESDDRPTLNELIAEVRAQEHGIDAVALTNIFAEKGYHPYNVQRIMHRALESGLLRIGQQLLLFATEMEAAA